MKKGIVSTLILVLVLFSFGCTSVPESTAGTMTDANMPPWASDPVPPDMIYGIGVASNAQPQMRMTMADAGGRQDIARQLRTAVEGMVTDFAQEAGGVDNTAAIQFQQTVSRQVAQANLSGARRGPMWTTPDGKTLWMRIEMNKADAMKAAEDEISKAIDSEGSRFAEFKASEALKMMEAKLAENKPEPTEGK